MGDETNKGSFQETDISDLVKRLYEKALENTELGQRCAMFFLSKWDSSAYPVDDMQIINEHGVLLRDKDILYAMTAIVTFMSKEKQTVKDIVTKTDIDLIVSTWELFMGCDFKSLPIPVRH